VNIEEYAAQFPIIKREDVKKGQTILAKAETTFKIGVAPYAGAFSSFSELRLVEDVKPEIEDGFYVDYYGKPVIVKTDTQGVKKRVKNGMESFLDDAGTNYLAALKRLYTVEELLEIDDKLGFCFTARGFLEKVKEGKF
jgi:hypothetical protein